MRRIIYTCLIFLSALSAYGQSRTNEVMRMFDQNERGIWIRQYEGLSNDLNPVSLILGHTQSEYRGLLLEKGLPDYEVEGEVNGTKLQLLVLNANQEVVGYVQGIVTDSLVQAEWNYVKASSIRDLLLKRTVKLSGDISCSQNKWVKQYTGQFLDDDATFFLQKEEEGSVYGLLHLAEKDVSYQLDGNCKDPSCLSIQLYISNHKGTDLGDMSLEILDKKHAQMVMPNNAVWLFSEDKTYKVRCGTQITRDAQLSFVVPSLNHEEFDRWTLIQINKWLKSFESDDLDHNLDLVEYNFWMDVESLGPEMISGLMNRNAPDGSIIRESFTFDLQKGKRLDWSTFIKKEDEFQETVQAAISAEKERQMSQEGEVAQVWLEEQSYQHLTLRKEGLCYHTDYSSIFGARSIVVPWNLVEDYIRKSESLKKKIR